MKNKRVKILAATAILVGGTTLGFYWASGRIIKAAIETFGPHFTKTEVRVGSVLISPFSGSGSIRNFLIENPAGYTSKTAVELDNVEVKVNLASLRKNLIIIDDVQVIRPKIFWEGSLLKNNLSVIQANVEAAIPKGNSDSSPQKKILIRRLLVRDAQVDVRLDLLGKKSIPISLKEIELKNVEGNPNAVFAEIFAAVLSSATSSLKSSGNILGKGAKGIIDGVKGLFGGGN
jgi:hypothetical protein